MVWGGLRGAVGLALALIVLHDKKLDPTGDMQSKVGVTKIILTACNVLFKLFSIGPNVITTVSLLMALYSKYKHVIQLKFRLLKLIEEI